MTDDDLSSSTGTPPQSSPTASLLRRLAVVQIAMVVLLAALAVVGLLSTTRTLDLGGDHAREINLAGRQRMLSQAVVKQALLARLDAGAESSAALEERIEQWLDQGAILAKRETAEHDIDPGMASLDGQLVALAALREGTIELARAVASRDADERTAEVDELLVLQREFLQLMETVVSQYEREVAAHVRRASAQAMAFVAAMVVLALLGALLVLVLVRRAINGQVAEEARLVERLREGEALKGAILESALDCVVTIDQDSRVLEFNPAAERTFGYRREDVIGGRMDELIVPPALREAHRAGMAKFLATGEGPVLGKRIEIDAMRSDGSIFPVELAITPITVGSRRLFTAYLRDITERRESEESIRAGREQYRSLVDGLNEIVFSTDENGRLTFLNPAWSAVTGRSVEESIGHRLSAFLEPEDRDLLSGDPERRESAGELRRVVRLRNTTGVRRWLELRARAVTPGPESLSGTLLDVTDRRDAEERTARLARLQQITQQVISSFVTEEDLSRSIDLILSETGSFLDVSRSYLFRYRNERSDLSNTHEWCADGVPSQRDNLQNLPADMFPFWNTQLEKGRLIVIADVANEAPREVRDLLVAQNIQAVLVLPVVIHGRLEGFIGFDETRHRRTWQHEEVALLQTMVESFSRAIERRVAERDRHAAAERLRMALVRAESANRLKSEFLANMSHELRTPMTAILGYAGLFRRRTGSSDQHVEWGDAIHRNADHLLSLLNDVLDLSKIEAGQLSLNIEECDPQVVLESVHVLMAPMADEKMLRFEARVDGAVPALIRTDLVRLRQILINLVSNAIKYTDEGSVTALMRTEIDDRTDEARLVVSVEDTGIGIPVDRQAGIFSAFNQAHEDAAARQGGVGLGLNIAQRLAHLLGGSIRFISTPESGSTFTLTVDLGPAGALDMVPARSAEALRRSIDAAISPTDSPVQDRRLLVVEDGRDNQRLLGFLLGEHGADVEVASDGEEGVRAVEAAARSGRPFDAVLMDMQMPVMDGYDATRTLRERGHTLPVIALTAHAMAGDRDRCIDVGCNDYVSKPVEEAQLLAALARAMVRPRDGGASTEPVETAADATASATEPESPSALPERPWMAALRRDFRASFPETISRIRELRETASREELSAIAHRLKGTAGSFGHPEITEVAARCEQGLRGDEVMERIDADLDALVELLEQAAEPSS